jgi:hypothetical protein
LQELEAEQANVPAPAIEKAGYKAAWVGRKAGTASPSFRTAMTSISSARSFVQKVPVKIFGGDHVPLIALLGNGFAYGRNF